MKREMRLTVAISEESPFVATSYNIFCNNHLEELAVQVNNTVDGNQYGFRLNKSITDQISCNQIN